MPARDKLPVRLVAPSFSLFDEAGELRLPTVREQVRDFFVSLDFSHDRRRLLSFVFEAYHVATFGTALVFCARYVTPLRLGAAALLLFVFAIVWNTVWYHRYCSHRAFSFRRPVVARFFLWLNPIGFREEIYALLHYPHHIHTDTPRDPYGPHLGRLGSYVASGRFRIDTELTEAEYEGLKRLIVHVPIRISSLANFKRWGSVESPLHYLVRLTFANIVWALTSFTCGGLPGLLLWYTTVFVFTFLMRDFNFRGHGGGKVRHRDRWDFDRSHLGINQWFYGIIAGEWHNNHHMYSRSARSGFLPGQIDVPFGFLVALRWLGVVDRLNDNVAQFRERTDRLGPLSPYAAVRRRAMP